MKQAGNGKPSCVWHGVGSEREDGINFWPQSGRGHLASNKLKGSFILFLSAWEKEEKSTGRLWVVWKNWIQLKCVLVGQERLEWVKWSNFGQYFGQQIKISTTMAMQKFSRFLDDKSWWLFPQTSALLCHHPCTQHYQSTSWYRRWITDNIIC